MIGIAGGMAVLGTALRHSASNPNRIQLYRDRRLRRIIRHARQNVPLYRDLWDAPGVSPEHVRSAGDLTELPVVTRKDFRARPLDETLARGFDPARLMTIHTTGSTGEPLAVRRTRAEDFVFHVFRMRAMSSFGLRPADRMARVGTHSHEQSPLAWRAAQRLGLFRQDQVRAPRRARGYRGGARKSRPGRGHGEFGGPDPCGPRGRPAVRPGSAPPFRGGELRNADARNEAPHRGCFRLSRL